MLRVIHVEPDAAVRAAVASAFANMAINAVGVGTATELAAEIDRHGPSAPVDLVVVDDDVFGSGDAAWRYQVRGRGSLPIIVTTRVNDSVRRLEALELGADDVLSKPFDPRELGARVLAVSRRVRPARDARMDLGLWTLDAVRRCIRDHMGREWQFPTRQFRILQVLAEEPGRIVGRDQLSQAIRGTDDDPFSRYIDNLVCKLRLRVKEICRESGTSDVDIQAIRHEGYQLQVQSAFPSPFLQRN